MLAKVYLQSINRDGSAPMETPYRETPVTRLLYAEYTQSSYLLDAHPCLTHSTEEGAGKTRQNDLGELGATQEKKATSSNHLLSRLHIN